MEYETLRKDNLRWILQPGVRGAYLFNADRFIKNFTDLLNEFRRIYPNTKIAYSYKTNWTPDICNIVNTLGGYAEVTSPLEYKMAKEVVGVQNENIIYNGLIPSHYMHGTVAYGGKLNVESHQALGHVLETAARRHSTQLKIGIRIGFDQSRFGFKESAVESVVKKITDHGHIVAGIHCHIGGGNSRTLDAWGEKTDRMLKIADKIEKITGYPLEYIDLGGHLYGRMHPELARQFKGQIPTFKDYAETVATKTSDAYKDKDSMPELILEPGTALVGDAVTILARVETVKEINGQSVITLSVSSYDCGMVADYKNLPVENISNMFRSTSRRDTKICGYTCMEEDYINRASNIFAYSGDVVHIQNCGAYSISMKGNFIYEPLPVYMVDDRYNMLGISRFMSGIEEAVESFSIGGKKCKKLQY